VAEKLAAIRARDCTLSRFLHTLQCPIDAAVIAHGLAPPKMEPTSASDVRRRA